VSNTFSIWAMIGPFKGLGALVIVRQDDVVKVGIEEERDFERKNVDAASK
jgi:hypothetical protein